MLGSWEGERPMGGHGTHGWSSMAAVRSMAIMVVRVAVIYLLQARHVHWRVRCTGE